MHEDKPDSNQSQLVAAEEADRSSMMLSSNCSDNEGMQYLSHNFGQVRKLGSDGSDQGQNHGLLINQHLDDNNRAMQGKKPGQEKKP
jgi:hypothetical protein